MHLIECAFLDEAREKAKQLVFIYKNNNPSSASSVLIHTQPTDKREIQEHKLAAVEKVDKQHHTSDKAQGGGQHSHNKQHSPQHTGNNHTHRGQGNNRQQRGRFNYRGNNQRGRGYFQNDQTQSFGAEVMEEAVDMTKIRKITDLTTNMVEVEAPSVDHGEPVGITPEDVDLP